MDVHQVEEFYIYTNNKDIDFDAAQVVCDEYGYDFKIDGDTAVIETFYSESAAEELGQILEEKASI